MYCGYNEDEISFGTYRTVYFSKIRYIFFAELCLQWLLQAGDWNTVAATAGGGGGRPNWQQGGGRQTPPSSSLAFSLARSLATLMGHLTTNSSNQPLVKKLGRDIWELITPLVSSGVNKRAAASGQAAAAATMKERGEVFLFVERISSQELALLVLSLLATLFNVARQVNGRPCLRSVLA